MKKIILVVAALFFSLLFYKKNAGLNLLLFSILTTTVLYVLNRAKFKEKRVLLAASLYILMSFFVFFHHSDLAIFSSIVTFLFFIGTIAADKSSLYIKIFNGLYTSIAGVFTHYFDKETEIDKKETVDYIYWLKIIIIPLVVIIIFVLLYKNVNPVFADLVAKIDLSFINLSWLLFTGLGYYFFSNIAIPLRVDPATQKDLETDNILRENPEKAIALEKIQKENQLGVVLMILLNSLLVLLIITDIIYLNQQGSELLAEELKAQLHQSVGSLITSIIFAISIIIYFFRSKLNFYKKNSLLKNTTFFWIALNIIIALLTAYKNYQYITSYGITYKRIGVYIYLLLALSGLVFTFIKVKDIKNIFYLFRTNMQVAFVVLLLATTVNWDILITKINIKNNHLGEYTLHLSDKNAPLLKKHADNTSNLSNEDRVFIEQKYDRYTRNLSQNSWQEMVYTNFKIKK